MITTFSNFKTGQYHFRHSKCIEYNIKRLPATADSLFFPLHGLHITKCNPCKVRVKSPYNLYLILKKCFIYAVFKSFYLSMLFIVGNSKTSLMAAESVNSITILSMPNPIPPVGGIPTIRALIKSSSVWLASSSPAASISS